MFLHGLAHVVGADDRAQAPRGGDGLKAGHARAENEGFGGGNGARGGHQHREHFRQRDGGQQHGRVPGNRRHGGKRIHALGARDPGHQLHREEGHTGGSQVGTFSRRGQRLAEPDDGLSVAE